MNVHPWHPAVVHFPVACWVLATALDVAGRVLAVPAPPGLQWAALAHWLLWSGVVLAIPAMLAGLIDYARLPPPVQAHATLLSHVALMAAAWLVFLSAAVWRARAAPFGAAAANGVLLLEALGTMLLIAGGRAAATVVYALLPRAGGEGVEDPAAKRGALSA